MKLVSIHQGQVVVSSVDIALNFDKRHKDVLRAIRNIECSDEFSRRNFAPWSYQVNNRQQPCYLLTRDGFSFLVMGFTGKEAAQWKEKYIKAFNAMEKKLLSQNIDQDWQRARLQSKQVRRTLTDVIKDFVEYAKSQGSSNAQHYYSNITKMEYKALGLLDLYSNSEDLRSQLNLMNLSFLVAAENICQLTLEEGMSKQMNYKDIYQLAKTRVMDYANVVNPIKAFSNRAIDQVAS